MLPQVVNVSLPPEPPSVEVRPCVPVGGDSSARVFTVGLLSQPYEVVMWLIGYDVAYSWLPYTCKWERLL